MKQDYLQIRIGEEEKAEIAEIVARIPGDVTVSQFVREAVREKIAELRKAEEPQPVMA